MVASTIPDCPSWHAVRCDWGVNDNVTETAELGKRGELSMFDRMIEKTRQHELSAAQIIMPYHEKG